MIRLFDFVDNIRLRKKNIYFQYSEDEQFTGEYWRDGKKIFSKLVRHDANGSANINTDVDTGLSSSDVDEIWIDYQNSFVYFNADGCSGSLLTISRSGWYGIHSYLINLTSSGNIKLNIQSNSNTAVNRCYIALKYTKK